MHELHWNPEDMADRPDAFLKDIDPETDNFGLKSALELWLKLEKMDLWIVDLEHRPEKVLRKH